MNVYGKKNVHVVHLAAGARPGRARFTLAKHSEVSRLSREGDDPGNQIVVDVVMLDRFVFSRKLMVEAIKIDVEGYDIDVIQGALHVLAKQEPLVLTEAKPDGALFVLMRKVGYRVFAFVRHKWTRKKRFVELFPDRPIPGETKMLFLVPGRLTEEFTRLVNHP
jgi:hypothetical protein